MIIRTLLLIPLSAFLKKTPQCKECPSFVCKTIYQKEGCIKGYCLQTRQRIIGSDKCKIRKQSARQLSLFDTPIPPKDV